ncbi:unnamed protein product [Larinioides sclopetarius]|uniref:Cytochrome P450 n=1 Tax=Larinioides sclopetarius TaxID=280406 RepID=A0AAV1ZX92_9ARAC
MLLLLTTCVLAGVITIIVKCSLWRKKCSQLLAGEKPGFFDILGDLKEFILYDNTPDKYFSKLNYLEVLKRRTEKYRKQKLFCLWITYMPFVCLVKAEAVKELLIEKRMLEKSLLYKWFKPILGYGLITSSVAKWKPRKKLLVPCFHLDVLRGFLPVFNEQSRELVEYFQKETTKDFSYIETPITLTTLDIICETMFGVKVGALGNDTSEYVQSVRRVLEIFMLRMSKIWLWPDFIFKFTKLGREMNDGLRMLHNFTRNIIQEKKKRFLRGEKDQNDGKRKALLDMLLQRHIEADELDEEDIGEEVDTFALAGHETVSTTIIWALYLIGLNTEIQARIHEELDRVFGENSERPVSEEDLSQLQYLECVLKETNRLCPAVPLFGRNIPETTEICGQTLPKETSCLVLTYFLHRDEEVFPDPERFDPDRFSPENCPKIPEFAYVPFGAGPRNCIGQRFALMEMKTLVSSILRNFTIESLDPRDKIHSFISITLRPSAPIRIKIRPRKKQKSC